MIFRTIFHMMQSLMREIGGGQRKREKGVRWGEGGWCLQSLKKRELIFVEPLIWITFTSLQTEMGHFVFYFFHGI